MRLPNWLGDGVMSTPCIELLLTHFPNARLCLIAPKSILELFSADSRIYACFEDTTKQSKNRLKATWQLGRAIRSKLECKGGIDIAITLTNHFYSALLLYACGSRVRIGYKRGIGNMLLTHKLAKERELHQVESYVRLLDLLPQTKSKKLDSSLKATIPSLRLCVAPKQIVESKPLRIGLNPGAAYGSAKCWDKEHYARVGAHFVALGAEVVIYGVEADRKLAEEIIASIDSALGEQCGSVVDFVEGTTTKVANLCHKAQGPHSSTANPRILEEKSQAQGKNQTTLESKKLDSSFLASLQATTKQKPTLAPTIINACGQTTIPTLLQELQTLDLFITNDSGSMHIATALEVPMVAIFGPTNMTETAPWQAKNCILLNLKLPCAPCKKRVCPLGHHKCMKDLHPEIVLQAAHKLLETHQASSNQAQTLD